MEKVMKDIAFAISYGMDEGELARKLAEDTDLELEEAIELIESYKQYQARLKDYPILPVDMEVIKHLRALVLNQPSVN